MLVIKCKPVDELDSSTGNKNINKSLRLLGA